MVPDAQKLSFEVKIRIWMRIHYFSLICTFNQNMRLPDAKHMIGFFLIWKFDILMF